METINVGRGLVSEDRQRNRPSPIFLAMVAVWVAAGWALWTEVGSAKFSVFVFVMVGWVVSLCLHEYGHARTAYWGGDYSVAGRGYLTLDPRKYVDPGLSLILPLVFLLMGGIGLPGGAVYVHPASICTRWQRSLMSAAGPTMNIAIGTIGGLVFVVAPDVITQHTDFAAALAFLVRLQFVAAILNLLPLPGLDGFGVIEPFLGQAFLASIAPYRRYTFLLLFFVAFRSQAFSDFVFGNANRITEGFGVPYPLIYLGRQLFMFWQ